MLAVAVPQPDRRREIFDAEHHPDEPPGLARIVRWPQLEHHLVLVAQVDPLDEPALRQAPEVEVMAEPPAQEILGIQAVLDHRWGRPL